MKKSNRYFLVTVQIYHPDDSWADPASSMVYYGLDVTDLIVQNLNLTILNDVVIDRIRYEKLKVILEKK